MNPSLPSSEKPKYPKQVFLIFVNEFCERFCFYGLRALLTLYFTNFLYLDETTSKEIYHGFMMLCYFFPLIGAIISDSWFGKFWTILIFSIVYTNGTVLLTSATIKPLHFPAYAITILSLILIALGTGGIKPCVSSFGADQFILPAQDNYMTHFFYLFYFSVNIGSALSTAITPVLKSFKCMGDDTCYALGYGLPAIFMIIALIIFVMGKPLYRIINPEENVILKWVKCIGTGIKGKIRPKKKVDHWLDHGEEKFGKIFVEHVKQTLRIVVIFLPIILFWALFDQQGGGWLIQATLMNCDLGSFNVLPEQTALVNPVLVLVFIPAFSFGVYPLCAKCKILTTPLQRISLGGIISALSFFIAAFISLRIEQDFTESPSTSQCHIRFYNPLPCTATVTATPYVKNKVIEAMGYAWIKLEDIHGEKKVDANITGCEGKMNFSSKVELIIKEKETLGYFMTYNGLVFFEDSVKKHPYGNPQVRSLVGNPSENVTIIYKLDSGEEKIVKTDNYSLLAFDPGKYSLSNSNQSIVFREGGVYTVLLQISNHKIEKLKFYEITKPNSLSVLWQLPQITLITIGEVLLSPTGLEFAYTQAPASMKSVMAAVWLMTTAIGNLLVVVIEAATNFEKQSHGFFLYGGLMLLIMGIFIFIATRYHYVKYGEGGNEPATN